MLKTRFVYVFVLCNLYIKFIMYLAKAKLHEFQREERYHKFIEKGQNDGRFGCTKPLILR